MDNTPMHNPTRRAKRFKRPLSSTRPLHREFPEASDICSDGPGGESACTNNPNYCRHRQAAQPLADTLRGAMLVAFIVVSIVLCIILWQLERPSFALVPKLALNRSAVAGSRSSENRSKATSTPVSQDDPVPVSGEGLNLSDERITAPSSKPSHTVSNTWPPRITRVPGGHGPNDRIYRNENTTPSSLDTAYCNGACRFLLPVRIGEQESKARIHFTQLLELARRLNRTIVLPNVGKSRLNACSEWPFDAYYDTSEFVKHDDASGFRLAIDLEDFAKWVDGRQFPSSFVVSMESIPWGGRDALGTRIEPFIVEEVEVDPKIVSCLESKLGPPRSSLPEMGLSISFDTGPLKLGSNASTQLIQLLSTSLDIDTDSKFGLMMEPGYGYTPQFINSSHLSLADVDVLVLDYDLRYPLFAASAQSSFNLHYAPVLYDLADRLSGNLGPFVSVHWRMESVPVQNLAWCAASLVSTLRALLQDDVTGKNVQHVWLATDHSRPLSGFTDGVRFPTNEDRMSNGDGSTLQSFGPLRKSSTFKALSSENDDAIGILVEAFRAGGDLEAWKLTDLAEQLSHYPYIEGRFEVDEALLDDSGVFGILDKLVVVQARAFVSGSTECSKISSFSKQVIEARQELFDAERGRGTVRNVVEYFGTW